MMKIKLSFLLVMTIPFLSFSNLTAQEGEDENPSKFSAGADFFSSFVWRGSKLGTGPAFQPNIDFSTGGLTLGVWGSFDAAGYMESDLYASYSFPFGLTLGITDYYLPDLDLFDVSDTAGSHGIELTAGFEIKGLSLSANYIVNEAGGVGTAGGDMYFEAGYAFEHVSLFLGAGNGWHTSDGEFAICNVGLGTGKTIKVTDSFSIEVTGQVVFNPERKQLFGVVGFSL